MIVVVNPTRQNVVFAFILSEFQRERTVGAPFAIRLCALVSGFSLLTPVAVKHIHTVAIRIKSLCTLRNHFDVLRRENFTDFITYGEHILERKVVQLCHININYSFLVVIAITTGRILLRVLAIALDLIRLLF